MTSRIVVGFDGSAAATAAFTWAADQARSRDADLVVCIARDGTEDVPDPPAVDRPVTVRRSPDDAVSALLAAAVGADLLVVGSRGRGRLVGLVLGSVSRAVLMRAPCPVVVVRELPAAASAGRVVVGVDGSEPSRHALAVAAAEAQRRGTPLTLVHAVRWEPLGAELLTPTVEQLLDWGNQLVAGELEEANLPDGVAVDTIVEHGDAAEVLVRHSVTSDLLVVGARGKNAAAGLLLGSTSEDCARRAECPVLVTRGPAPSAASGPGTHS